MTDDDVHGLLDRALPPEPVPFHVDPAAIVARGRRRRRRTVTAVAGVTLTAVLGAVLATAGLASTPRPDAAADPSGESSHSWDDSRPWQRTERQPVTDERVVEAGDQVAAAVAAELFLTVDGFELGRYTETAPDGADSRQLLYGDGTTEVDGAEYTVTASIYEPGIAADPTAFVDCDVLNVSCGDISGEADEPVLLVNRDTVSGGTTIRALEVYVYRPDETVAKLAVTPILAAGSPAEQLVEPPMDSTQLCDAVLAFPQDLPI